MYLLTDRVIKQYAKFKNTNITFDLSKDHCKRYEDSSTIVVCSELNRI